MERTKELCAGSVIRIKDFRHHFNAGNGMLEAGYKAGKGKVFLCMVLGVEDADASPDETGRRITEHMAVLGFTVATANPQTEGAA